MSEDGLDLDAVIALEGRITAALDRIAGAAAVNAVAAQSAEETAALADAQARVEELNQELAAAKDAQEALQAEVTAAKAALSDVPAADDNAAELATLQEKTERLRGERASLRDERDGLAEELDAYRSAANGEPGGLLTALRDLRQANVALRQSCETLRKAAAQEAGAPSPDALDTAMAAELLSMQAERAADAAEMRLILDELRPMTEGAGDA